MADAAIRIDYDSPEFKERRRLALIGILEDAQAAMKRQSFRDARDLAATAASAIDIEFCGGHG
jgi:hypothetical protein